MKTQDIKNIATALKGIREAAMKPEVKKALAKASASTEKGKKAVTLPKAPFKIEAMDPVDKSELKGKHKDRKDKDIDNDGDVDSSDKFLHKRRKAVSKAMAMASKKKPSAEKDADVEVQESKQNISEGGMVRIMGDGSLHHDAHASRNSEGKKREKHIKSVIGKTTGGDHAAKVEKIMRNHSLTDLQKKSHNHWLDAGNKAYKSKNESVFGDQVEAAGNITKGSTVIALTGPHKGDKHEVIHDFGNGHVNVMPMTNKVRYSHGAAKAKVSDLKLVEAKLMSDDDVAKMVAKKLGNKKNTDRYDQIAVIKGILNKSPKQKGLATDREFIDGVLDILFKKYKFISNQRESVDVLDEISKKTLGSYIKKAASDKADNAYNLGAKDPLGKKGSWSKSFKRRKGIAMATDKLTKESKNHGNMNNGSPAGEGLSPNAKKMLAMKTPMPDAVNEPVVDKKTFAAIRASGKKAAMRSGDNAKGETKIKPSATDAK